MSEDKKKERINYPEVVEEEEVVGNLEDEVVTEPEAEVKMKGER